MASDGDAARGGLTRRALILTAPALLVPGVALAALAPTPGAREGPFYPVRMPSDDDADLIRVEGAVREAGGDILHLAGRVMDANARPIAGARIEIWQCDANGVYLHPGDRRRAARDAGFQGFGHAKADTAGRFAFRTIVPVPYPGRTPHIHVKVLRGGARPAHDPALPRGPSPEPVRLPVSPLGTGPAAPRLAGHQTARRIPPPRLRNRIRPGDRGLGRAPVRTVSGRSENGLLFSDQRYGGPAKRWRFPLPRPGCFATDEAVSLI